jgi:LacI family transcriptional regulator
MRSKSPKPTIATVAEAAGVSIATVSRVVRGHADVHERTRARVLAVIEELGYRPSPLARALVSGRSRTLGLIVSDISNPFYPQLAREVEQSAAAEGWAVVICNTDDDPDVERQCLERLLDQGIGGIIHGSARLDSDAVEVMVKTDVPIVFVNRRPHGSKASYVLADNELGARKLTAHLLDLGHRRIGFIGGPDFACNARERLNGFLAMVEEHGEDATVLVATGDFETETGRSVAADWLGDEEQRPTAIIGVNDMVALGAMEAVLAAGLRVPDDVAVAGFDDIELAGSALISLTSVAQHIDEMGRKAVRAVLRLARQPKARRRHMREVLEPELIVRRSTLATARPAMALGTRA